MRLSSKEVAAIRSACAKILQGIDYQVYLFGNRADDQKKGGDIDLLIVTSNKTEVVSLKTNLKLEIFTQMAEQKIDITVAQFEELQTEPFLQEIFPKAIRL